MSDLAQFGKLVMYPKLFGGTGVTNFDIREMPLYRAALLESGRADLVLCSVGYPTPWVSGLQRGDGSLHRIGQRSMKSYWDIFHRIKKQKDQFLDSNHNT